MDENGIFGGDEWAMKAAAHEIKVIDHSFSSYGPRVNGQRVGIEPVYDAKS